MQAGIGVVCKDGARRLVGCKETTTSKNPGPCSALQAQPMYWCFSNYGPWATPIIATQGVHCKLCISHVNLNDKDYLFIKIRNLRESWAWIFFPLHKWQKKKVQQFCPDSMEHLTSIYALYKYRNVLCNSIIREMVQVVGFSLFSQDTVKSQKFYKIFLFKFFFCRKIYINGKQNNLAIGSQILVCSRYLFHVTNSPKSHWLKMILCNDLPCLCSLIGLSQADLPWSLSDSCIQIVAGAGVIWRLDRAERPTWLTHKAVCVGCWLGAQLGCWLELLCMASPCTWPFQKLEAGLLEGASPVSIARGRGRSWEVSYSLVLEVLEHHVYVFCCPADHQGQPTPKAVETESTSPWREAGQHAITGREGIDGHLEIISHIHSSPWCLETKADILMNDLNFNLYQVRLFAKERPHFHCSYRRGRISSSLMS